MLNLAIVAATVVRPADRCEAAAPRRYRHLASEAGQQSLPPSVAHRAAMGLAAPPGALFCAAGASTRALALQAAQALAAGLDATARQRVGSLIHTGITLDEQPLASICLDTAQQLFPAAPNVFGLGQVGSAGLLAGLQLAAVHATAGLGATVLTAADRWLPPFDRHFGALVSLGDGAAALLVDDGAAQPDAWARVRGCATRLLAGENELWDRPLPASAEHLLAALRDAAHAALAQAGWDASQIDALAGDDSLGFDIAARLAAALNVHGRQAVEGDALHLSSAAFAASLLRCAQASAQHGRPLRCLVWTAAPGGAAGAAAIEIEAARGCLRDGVFIAVSAAVSVPSEGDPP